jgi:hypothetical protein
MRLNRNGMDIGSKTIRIGKRGNGRRLKGMKLGGRERDGRRS